MAPPEHLSRRDVLAGLTLGLGAAALAGCSDDTPSARTSGSSSTTTRRATSTTTTTPGRRTPDSRPDPSRPEGDVSMPEIEHIVIYIQENHSYDNYFGMLGRGDGFTKVGGKPTNSNPDRNGRPVPVYHADYTCDRTDQASQTWNGTHLSINGGKMDGFVTSADRGGHGSMGYWDGSDLPFYYDLAMTFPVCDRWFASAPCQTFPNRLYVQAATSMGVVSTDVAQVLAAPAPANGVIWERLNAHGITWANYVVDLADIQLFPSFYDRNKDKVRHLDDFLRDCAKGTLPQVCFVSPGHKVYSEENPWDIQLGEAYSASVINAVLRSPAWSKTAMFMTYDEHGGYYDHVAPPAAIPPDSIKPAIDTDRDQPGGFDLYGLRVPSLVISPYAKRDYVSHVVHDHTSILKFVETKFNLGALTFRDANADDLLDCFDFERPAFEEPPTLAAPHLANATSSCAPEIPKPATTAAP